MTANWRVAKAFALIAVGGPMLAVAFPLSERRIWLAPIAALGSAAFWIGGLVISARILAAAERFKSRK